jgi:hypothetical protein
MAEEHAVRRPKLGRAGGAKDPPPDVAHECRGRSCRRPLPRVSGAELLTRLCRGCRGVTLPALTVRRPTPTMIPSLAAC